MLARFAAVAALAAAVVVAMAVVVTRGDGPAPKVRAAATATPATPAEQPAERPAKQRPKRAAIPPAPADVKGAAARRMEVPILMYHVVSKAPAGAAIPELWVDETVFAQEMDALEQAGYHAITLRQAFDAWQHGGPLPRKPVVVSFDDGYLSHYTHAKPVLRRLGWPGVLNLELRNIGKDGITERQVRSLMAAGWEVDSHTLTHPDLTTITDAQLKSELAGSRAQLRKRFGSKVAEFLCYPAGRYDERVVAAVRAAGYRGATTVEEGFGDRSRPFTLKRVRVNGSDTADSLLSRLGDG